MARKWDGLGEIGPIGKLPPLKPKAERPKLDLEPIAGTEGPRATLALDSADLRDLERRVGYRWAKAVMKLKDKGVMGSTPELLVYAWLQYRDIPFEFQSAMFGGRRMKGGLIPDFILWHVPEPMIVRVLGDYWHGRSGQQDKSEKLRLLGSSYKGSTISMVVDVGEGALYANLEGVMRKAIAGRGTET